MILSSWGVYRPSRKACPSDLEGQTNGFGEDGKVGGLGENRKHPIFLLDSLECVMKATLNDILADVARASGLDPFDWVLPDEKISGYIIPKFFGRDDAVAEVRRIMKTFHFDSLM